MMINKRLIGYVPQSKKHIAKNVVFQWLSLMMNILFMFFIGEFLQRLLIKNLSLKFILISITVCLSCILLRFVCAKFAAKESYLASKQIKKILRNNIYEKLLKIGNSYIRKISTVDILQSAIDGVEQLETYFGAYLPQLFYSLIAPITLFCVLSFIHFKSAIVLLLCVPLIPMSIIAIQKFSKRLISKYWGQYTKLGDSFLENLQGLTTLKIYQADEIKHKEMNKQAERFRKITMKVLVMQLNSITLMDLVAYGGTALGIILAVNGFANGNVDFKGCFIIIMLCAEYFLPLRLLGSFFHVAMNGMAASDKIFTLLDLWEKKGGNKESKSFDISIKSLTFNYNSDRTVLKNITIDIPEKSFISIVGKSGCGKSTIAEIIGGNYSDYKGSVKLGGIELSEIKSEFARKNITLISMQNYIFKGTVKDNLLMGDCNATNEEMWSVLDKVNLSKFLKTENGLETLVEEQGNNFSGGQRQRLAVARALLHKSKIYIFDEATSNIDVESENDILNVLHMLSKEKTVIFISHRLINVVNSDKIYVLDDGQVCEQGCHKQLQELQGIYYDLWNIQYELEQYRKVE